MPYVLANTSACAGAQDETMLVQSSSILSQPSLGLEFIHIRAENVLVVPYQLGVHADITTGGNIRSRYFEATHWYNSRHCQACDGVQTHRFFDGRGYMSAKVGSMVLVADVALIIVNIEV